MEEDLFIPPLRLIFVSVGVVVVWPWVASRVLPLMMLRKIAGISKGGILLLGSSTCSQYSVRFFSSVVRLVSGGICKIFLQDCLKYATVCNYVGWSTIYRL